MNRAQIDAAGKVLPYLDKIIEELTWEADAGQMDDVAYRAEYEIAGAWILIHVSCHRPADKRKKVFWRAELFADESEQGGTAEPIVKMRDAQGSTPPDAVRKLMHSWAGLFVGWADV